MFLCVVFFFKQKTAYEMRISDWGSDVCSSDLRPPHNESFGCPCENGPRHGRAPCSAHGDRSWNDGEIAARRLRSGPVRGIILATGLALAPGLLGCPPVPNKSGRSEERGGGKGWVRTGRSRWSPFP